MCIMTENVERRTTRSRTPQPSSGEVLFGPPPTSSSSSGIKSMMSGIGILSGETDVEGKRIPIDERDIETDDLFVGSSSSKDASAIETQFKRTRPISKQTSEQVRMMSETEREREEEHERVRENTLEETTLLLANGMQQLARKQSEQEKINEIQSRQINEMLEILRGHRETSEHETKSHERDENRTRVRIAQDEEHETRERHEFYEEDKGQTPKRRAFIPVTPMEKITRKQKS